MHYPCKKGRCYDTLELLKNGIEMGRVKESSEIMYGHPNGRGDTVVEFQGKGEKSFGSSEFYSTAFISVHEHILCPH